MANDKNEGENIPLVTTDMSDQPENKLPFRLCIDNVIKHPSQIEIDYPEQCIPSKLKNPQGSKAKKLQYEVIDESIYDAQARMVACRIKSKERILAWIHALGILYYDFYANNGYDVHWYDDPVEWQPDTEGSRQAICIDLTKDLKLLYKVTLFVTTGVIQAQGISKDLYTNRDFPVLKSMVEKTLNLPEDDHSGLCKARLALVKSGKEKPQSETFVKTAETEVISKDQHEGDMSKSNTNNISVSKKDPNNNQQQSEISPAHKSAHRSTEKDVNLNTVVKQASLTLTYDDIAQLQKSFIAALETVTRSQSDFIRKAESSFSSAITDALHPVVEAVDKLQKQINSFQNVQNPEKKSASADELNHVNTNVVPKLENQIKDLQQEVMKMKQDKHKAATDYFQLQSEHEMEKTKVQILKQQHEMKNKVIQEENQVLREKLKLESETVIRLTAENKELKTKNDVQFADIMSLKTQLSGLVSPQFIQPSSKSNDSEYQNQKPYALLIGTSNTERINEDRLSSEIFTSKKLAYTLDETLEVIENCPPDLNPDVVILHSLTNDVKTLSPNECVSKMENIVNKIHEKWEHSKCVVSLTTPRMDDRSHRVNCEILDGLLKMKYLENKDVYVSDNVNIWHGSTPMAHLLEQDKYHLNSKGCSILASNIKVAMHTVLGIRRRSSPPRYRGGGRGGKYAGRGGRGRRGGPN